MCPITHCSGEEAARLECLQCHGTGVSPKEQDEGHQGDVRHIATGLSDQLPTELKTLLPGEGCPGGIHWLERRGQRGSFNQQATIFGEKHQRIKLQFIKF